VSSSKSNKDEGAPVRLEVDFVLENYIPFRLVQADLKLRSVITPENLAAAAKVVELSKNETRVIAYIGLKGPVPPSSIAAELGLKRAVVTRCLNSLKQNELIVYHDNPADGRSKLLQLTENGANVCEHFLPHMQAFGEYLDEAITAKEKQILLKVLEKLIQAGELYDPPKR